MRKERVLEVLILLLTALALIFGAKTIYYKKFVKPNLYTITFQDIDSIIKGSPVRFMGIIVGHVRNLTGKNDKILCEIIVTKPGVKIPDGSVAKVQFNGLGGAKSVEIMPPDKNDPEIKGIVAAEALRISDFMDTFKNLREVLICVKGFVDGITPEGALTAVKAISSLENSTKIQNYMDKIDKKQEKIKNNFIKINKIEKYLDGFLKKFSK